MGTGIRRPPRCHAMQAVSGASAHLHSPRRAAACTSTLVTLMQAQQPSSRAARHPHSMLNGLPQSCQQGSVFGFLPGMSTLPVFHVQGPEQGAVRVHADHADLQDAKSHFYT